MHEKVFWLNDPEMCSNEKQKNLDMHLHRTLQRKREKYEASDVLACTRISKYVPVSAYSIYHPILFKKISFTIRCIYN